PISFTKMPQRTKAIGRITYGLTGGMPSATARSHRDGLLPGISVAGRTDLGPALSLRGLRVGRKYSGEHDSLRRWGVADDAGKGKPGKLCWRGSRWRSPTQLWDMFRPTSTAGVGNSLTVQAWRGPPASGYS